MRTARGSEPGGAGSVKGSAGERELGLGRAWGGGLRLCWGRKKLPPGTQDSCLNVSCRCLCSGCWGTLLLFPCLH